MVKRLLLLVVCLATLSPVLVAAKGAEDLFQDAMMKETGERDPEAAIPLYQLVIDRAGSDHRLVSKARLHLGLCLERLGKAKEAQKMYLEIIQDSAESLTDAVQAAQANLDKLIAQEKKAAEEADRFRVKPMMLVKEFVETRFSILANPAIIESGSKTSIGLALAARYRLSPKERPLALLAEVGGMFPLSGKHIKDDSKPFDATTTDTASLDLKNQIHIGVVAELPHGSQKRWIPEFGIGSVRTASTIDYASGTTGSSDEAKWSPRLALGLRGFADKLVSLHVEAAYVSDPYAKTVDIASPAHHPNFGFPKSQWTIGIGIQIKIGSTKMSMRPKE